MLAAILALMFGFVLIVSALAEFNRGCLSDGGVVFYKPWPVCVTLRVKR